MSDGDFDYSAWLAALHDSFRQSVELAIGDFRDGLLGDGFEQAAVTAALAEVQSKMLWSIQVNMDRLESFYRENSVDDAHPHRALLDRLESAGERQDGGARVTAVFEELRRSVAEFGAKKQTFLRHSLYDQYLDRERALTHGAEFFDVRAQEERVLARAASERQFLRDFGAYVDVFRDMQTQTLRKLH